MEPRGGRKPKPPVKRAKSSDAHQRPSLDAASVRNKSIVKSAKMTHPSKSDGDTLGVEGRDLRPIDRYILTSGQKLERPFCWEDFKDMYRHGSIRNAFSRLKKEGLIRLWTRSSIAFYVLPGQVKGYPRRKVTIHHTVGRGGVRGVRVDLGAFLDLLDWEDVCRVHDITLRFSVDRLYGLFLRNCVGRLVRQSKDVHFGPFTWSRGRVLKLALHRNGMANAYLKCSECPVDVSLDGLVGLASFLGGVRIRIVDIAASIDHGFDEQMVPDVSDWIVVQWHYGRNGAREISGPAFNVTFKTWFGELARVYMRHSGQLLKPRLEILQKPRKPLPIAFAEKIDPTFSVSRRLKAE